MGRKSPDRKSFCFFQKEAISLDPVAALEKRQESILARLTDLRQTLEKLTSQYSIPSDNGAKTGAGQVSALSCHVTSTEINSSLVRSF